MMQFPSVQRFSSIYPMEVGDRISTYRNWYREQPSLSMLRVITQNYGSDSPEVVGAFLAYEEGRHDAYDLLDAIVLTVSWQTAGVLFLMELRSIQGLEDSLYEELVSSIHNSRESVFTKFVELIGASGFELSSIADSEGLELSPFSGADG